MEAVSVARSEVFRCVQTSALTRFGPVHADWSTNLLGALQDGNGSRGHRLQCRALQQNEPTKEAAKGASGLLQKAVQLEGRNDKPKVQLSAAGRPGSRNGGPGSIARTFANYLFEFLQYTPLEEEKPYTMKNSASVDEIGEKVSVKLISGAIPQDFPQGAYIRTGPNPLFGGKSYKSRLGITRHHWVEGDGMLHTVYFDKCGDEYSLFYKNKYVETEAYLIEKEEGRPVVLATAECSTLLVNIFLNQLRFGFLTRPTSNTAVWSHSGRVFAAAEGNLPYEIDISDLRTLGKFNCKGAWPLDNFIAHSKIDPVTNEIIFQGMSTKKPYTLVGVIAADGETLVHTVGVNNERQTMNHDIMITERYTIVMDFPLLVDVGSTFRGKPVLRFDPNSFTRFGILPRFGDSDSIRWFEVETSFMFHTFNAYDTDNEVVVHGLRSRSPFLNIEINADKRAWYTKGITVCAPDQESCDPLVDGAILPYLHEWRFDLKSGTVTERDICEEKGCMGMEFPRVNDKYVGRKYRYGYAAVVDLDRARKEGAPYYYSVVKLDFSSVETGKGLVKAEFHEHGPHRYGGEPLFVARPGSTEEDDGWIVMFLYDETTSQSEAVIIDAKRFSEEPIARIRLPQRVPYGFHGTYVYSE
ncbi:hypothetical protein R1sor_020846 [Riccia sorocarpa]|uniref:Carotenoid cleavage dioxygenase n=1 Tax=Riccia sorocarpa TaxID=122646 RepID=A0ABD3GIP9_9MARC